MAACNEHTMGYEDRTVLHRIIAESVDYTATLYNRIIIISDVNTVLHYCSVNIYSTALVSIVPAATAWIPKRVRSLF